ncbi:hypothetical protein IAU59_001775 [Kwoniella sp. CBS 9459]
MSDIELDDLSSPSAAPEHRLAHFPSAASVGETYGPNKGKNVVDPDGDGKGLPLQSFAASDERCESTSMYLTHTCLGPAPTPLQRGSRQNSSPSLSDLPEPVLLSARATTWPETNDTGITLTHAPTDTSRYRDHIMNDNWTSPVQEVGPGGHFPRLLEQPVDVEGGLFIVPTSADPEANYTLTQLSIDDDGPSNRDEATTDTQRAQRERAHRRLQNAVVGSLVTAVTLIGVGAGTAAYYGAIREGSTGVGHENEISDLGTQPSSTHGPVPSPTDHGNEDGCYAWEHCR